MDGGAAGAIVRDWKGQCSERQQRRRAGSAVLTGAGKYGQKFREGQDSETASAPRREDDARQPRQPPSTAGTVNLACLPSVASGWRVRGLSCGPQAAAGEGHGRRARRVRSGGRRPGLHVCRATPSATRGQASACLVPLEGGRQDDVLVRRGIGDNRPQVIEACRRSTQRVVAGRGAPSRRPAACMHGGAA